MNKESFYMQLCYILLNKFSNNHIEITKDEFDKTVEAYITIKHRINQNGNLEVVAHVEEEIN